MVILKGLSLKREGRRRGREEQGERGKEEQEEGEGGGRSVSGRPSADLSFRTSSAEDLADISGV